MNIIFKYKNYILCSLILLGLSFFFYSNHFKKPPISIHAWAQSDRLSLAYGFLDNGFNLFKPETYFLNLVSKPDLPLKTQNGITQVDFPIHEYAIALLMKLTKVTSPTLFRLYTLLYSLIGLYFLFLLFSKISSSQYKAILIILFAITSPVFVYYQIGFLPTIPSIANVFIGYYFFYKYLDEIKKKYFILCCFFLTLAMLNRLPMGIHLITIFCYYVLQSIKQKKILYFQLNYILVGLEIVAMYFIYNQYLKSQYGSLFLTKALPPKNIEEVTELFKLIERIHLRNYFTDTHYVLICSALVFGVYFYHKEKNKNPILSSFALFSIISFAGGFFYSLLMLTQFKDHDYYFLDGLYIPITLLFGVCFSFFKVNLKLDFFIQLALSITFFILIIQEKKKLDSRFSIPPYDQISNAIIEVQNSYKVLDSLSISKDARLFILDSNNIANIELVHFRRKGYSFAFSIWDGDAKELILKSDYTLTLNKFHNKSLDSNYRETLNKLDTFFVNDKLTIYKKP